MLDIATTERPGKFSFRNEDREVTFSAAVGLCLQWQHKHNIVKWIPIHLDRDDANVDSLMGFQIDACMGISGHC